MPVNHRLAKKNWFQENEFELLIKLPISYIKTIYFLHVISKFHAISMCWSLDQILRFNIKNALVKGRWKKAKEIKKLWKHIRLVRLLIYICDLFWGIVRKPCDLKTFKAKYGSRSNLGQNVGIWKWLFVSLFLEFALGNILIYMKLYLTKLLFTLCQTQTYFFHEITYLVGFREDYWVGQL